MSAGSEAVRWDFDHEEARIREALAQEALRIQKLAEPETPAQTLGRIGLGFIFGGALGAGSVMPAAEAATLELIAGTTEYADSLSDQRRRAA